MSDSGGSQYFWCIRHNRVETPADVCAGRHVLGPYPTRQAAENALEQVRERNEAWEEQDARWEGEQR